MKVLVADDHWIVRDGLKHLLADLGGATIVEAANYDEAIAAVGQHRDLDLVLMDLMMPGSAPFAGLQAMLNRLPTVPVIVLSVLDARDDVFRAIELGAMGYCSKKATGKDILSVVKRVMAGEIWVPRDLVARSRKSSPGQQALSKAGADRGGNPIAALTERQREVFALLAVGKSNRRIAEDLGVSEHTVRVHISAILKALRVENRTQAAVLANEYQD